MVTKGGGELLSKMQNQNYMIHGNILYVFLLAEKLSNYTNDIYMC